MYLNFFGLHTQPFNITPDPALLYGTPSHNEALAAITYGIAERKGVVALIGEVGVGKTMMIRCALQNVSPDKVRIIQLFNADISFENLLHTLFESLGHVPPCDDLSGMVRQFHQILTDLYKAGINVVLVIDEAQNMPVETLHHLHLLSNLETEREKLIQIVFSGQPEFEDKLNSPALRQLKQRIAIKVRIVPLTRNESISYIAHRLAVAGHRGPAIFTTGAFRLDNQRGSRHTPGYQYPVRQLPDYRVRQSAAPRDSLCRPGDYPGFRSAPPADGSLGRSSAGRCPPWLTCS